MKTQFWKTLAVVTLLVISPARAKEEESWFSSWILPLAVGAGAVIAAPFALTAAGFTAGGIAAGSIAAKTMSVVYTTGYGLPALSALQSAGAAGLGLAGAAAVGAGATGVTKAAKKVYCNSATKKCD